MRLRRISSFLGAVVGALVTMSPISALAAWPERPVTIIVPFAAGGNTDGFGRMAAQRLGEAFGQTFIVENKPGAGGAIAADLVAKAAPDGYTLFLAALPVMAVVPAIQKVRYDVLKDFAPISNIGTNPFALVVNKDLPIHSLKEFVEYVRAHKGEMSYGSAGVGSLNHLSMALFLKQAGLEMVHVPYKGNAPALADVVGGHVQAMFSNLSDALPQTKAGNVRMLVVSSEQRSVMAKEVPTVAESGYPKYKVLTWNGLMAPAGTPKEIVEKISGEIAKAVKEPKFREQLINYGADPLGDTPAEYRAMLEKDIPIWAEAVDIAGAKQQ
ncbi:MAG TPA: tripartite tricarboxylate transporter substrate binding protein [Pseudolabrys sp.]